MALITFDIEADLIARANLAPEPVCISWTDPAPQVALIDDTRDMFEGWLRGDQYLVNQSIGFDMSCLGEYWPDLLPLIFQAYDEGRVESIDINQKIIDIATRGGTEDEYSLERMCERHKLPVPDKSSPWRMEFASLRGVPVSRWPGGAVSYCLEDADLPRQIHTIQHDFDAQWTARFGSPLLHLAPAEAYKDFCLRLASCWGIRTDPAKVEPLRRQLLEYLGQARITLGPTGKRFVREDGSSDTKVVRDYMASTVKNPRLTNTGLISLDKQACKEAKDETLLLYSEFTQAGKLLARMNDLAEGVELPLQTRFNSLLETSRTSSSKPKAPIVGCQCQNFPKKIGARECLKPRDGHGYVLADYATAELHSLGQVNIDKFGHSVMADKLNAGMNVHLWFAGQIVGRAYEELLPIKDQDDIKVLRDQAKPCNFGFPGGMGAEKFTAYAWAQYGVLFTETRAEELKDLWLRSFPEMREYFRWINRMMQGKSHALCKHIRSGRWRGRVPYCALCNTQFQELTATAAGYALCEVQRQCYTVRSSDLFDSRMIMFTHDEIVLETPLDRVHEAAMQLKKVMEDRFNEYHPDCPTEADPLVTMVYSKKAKRLTDANGRLIPYTGLAA